MSERKLKAWQEAGLIDGDAAQRIRAYESQHARPLALWAIVGLAALAIGLGLVSVIAANWDDIPGKVRIGLHMALIAIGGAALWLKGDDLATRQPWFHEAALFVFGMLGLTFFGHVGQVYQTDSPLWQPLAAWLVLFAPLLLSRGLSWLTAAGLFVVLVWAVWDYGSWSPFLDHRDMADGEKMRLAAITGLPVLIAPLAAWQRGRSARIAFWRRLRQMAVAYGVFGASMLTILAGFDDFVDNGSRLSALSTIATWAALAAIAAIGVVALRRTSGGRATALVLGASAAISILCVPLSGEELGGALLFMTLWAAIGWASLGGGWRRLFQLAVGLIALRLVILSFELNDDLLSSGLGLIFTGMLGLGVAWGAMRVSRRFAPAASEESE